MEDIDFAMDAWDKPVMGSTLLLAKGLGDATQHSIAVLHHDEGAAVESGCRRQSRNMVDRCPKQAYAIGMAQSEKMVKDAGVDLNATPTQVMQKLQGSKQAGIPVQGITSDRSDLVVMSARKGYVDHVRSGVRSWIGYAVAFLAYNVESCLFRALGKTCWLGLASSDIGYRNQLRRLPQVLVWLSWIVVAMVRLQDISVAHRGQAIVS